MRRAAPVVAAALLASGAAAHAAVFRCTAPDGRVTYQDAPCPASAETVATDIPTEYPPPNDAERARILEREAELARRVEARREREAREAAMRIATAPAPPPPPEPALEAYPLYWPYAAPRPHRWHGEHARGSHRGHGQPTSGPNAARP